MITSILETLRPVIENQAWVERYGGVVRTVNRPVYTEIDGVQEVLIESYPVSQTVTESECWEQGQYLDLTPNNALKSVCYFEEVTPMKLSGLSPNNGVTQYTSVVRFVAWLNMPMLGYNIPNFADYVAATMIKVLHKKNIRSADDAIFPFQLSIEPSEYNVKDKNVFNGYSYQNNQGLLFYPYDFFSILCNVKIDLEINCLPTYSANSPNNCF